MLYTDQTGISLRVMLASEGLPACCPPEVRGVCQGTPLKADALSHSQLGGGQLAQNGQHHLLWQQLLYGRLQHLHHTLSQTILTQTTPPTKQVVMLMLQCRSS